MSYFDFWSLARLEDRLARITRASDELDRCVRERGPKFDPMATLGECDWLWELHWALYEQEDTVMMSGTGRIETTRLPDRHAVAEMPDRVAPAKEHHGGLPSDAKARKTYPVFSGLLAYFPDALAETSHVSHVGNEQHNPGEPLRWAQEKSQDELDAMMRHLTDEAKGVERDTDGQYHLAKVIWRASAALQRKIEAKRRGMTVEQYNSSCRDIAGRGAATVK